jgi:hypothetical protein
MPVGILKIPVILIDWQNINYPAPNEHNLPDISMNFSRFGLRVGENYSTNSPLNIYNHFTDLLMGENYRWPLSNQNIIGTTGSVREYFNTVSHGQLNCQYIILNANNGISDVSGAYGATDVPKDVGVATYLERQAGGHWITDYTLWRTFLAGTIDQTITNGANWEQFIMVSNGVHKMPGVCFLGSGLAPSSTGWWGDFVWPHRSSLGDEEISIGYGGGHGSPSGTVLISNYNFTPMRKSSSAIVRIHDGGHGGISTPPETWGDSYGEELYDQMNGMGTICHENMHVLIMTCGEDDCEAYESETVTVPDLYDGVNPPSKGVGKWGLMGNGNYSGNTALPNFCSSWTRHQLGWAPKREGLTAEQIVEANGIIVLTNNITNIMIPPIELENKAFRINHPNNSDDYWLIENRQPINFDREIIASGDASGLAIWHINNSKINSHNAINGDQWEDEANQISGYGVGLEQADGQFDLEYNNNSGNASDLWHPLVSQNRFGTDTTPDTKGMDGTPSGINIFNIDTIGNEGMMKFSVTRTQSIGGPDIQPPVITLTGDAIVQHEFGALWVDPGATATDIQDGNIRVYITGTVNINNAGTYYIQYTATDHVGNIGMETRIVEVQEALPGHLPENIIYEDVIPPFAFEDISNKIGPTAALDSSRAMMRAQLKRVGGTIPKNVVTKKKGYSNSSGTGASYVQLKKWRAMLLK